MLARYFGVTAKQIVTWIATKPEFSVAVKKGREEADVNVARSLYHRAVGYSHRTVKTLIIDKEIVHDEYIERFPPDVTACIYWLKVRQNWRENKPTDESGNLVINIYGGLPE